jgi:CspA family cold shock protein
MGAKKLVKTESGKIKFFNSAKGFGFISDTSDGKEYFFHYTGLIDKPVDKDDEVFFELEEGQRGIKAVNITKK